MDNKIIKEISIRELNQILLDLDYPHEIVFEVGKNSYTNVHIRCKVLYMPHTQSENGQKSSLCFGYNEKDTMIEIPNESIKQIIVTEHFNALWMDVTIKCVDGMEYHLSI